MPPDVVAPNRVQGTRNGALTYIREIDGLRAIAVLAVMLYHLNPILMPGGFIGVDVFFVISGYVVTASLWRDINRPFASIILNFYSRRILRILPALMVCLIVTALATALFVPDSWLSSTTTKTALFAFFGASNFALYGADAYFSPRIEYNPFAHTWSLAIEEQFYIILPTLIYFFVRSRYGRPIYKTVFRYELPLLCVLSFAISAFGSKGTQEVNFYMLPGRFWELGIGALLFQLQTTGNLHTASYLWNRRLVTIGLVLIALAATLADRRIFPFPWAIPAASGSFLVIAAVSTQQGSPYLLCRLLRSPTMTVIGKISYSLYLWHWPVYSIFRWTVGLRGLMLPILAFLISSSLGYLSYKIVERPIREGKRVLALPKIVVVAAGAAVVIVGALATREGLHDKARLSLSVVERAKTDWYPDTWPDSAPPAECTMRRTVEDVGEVAVSSFQRSCNGEGNGHAIRHLFVVGDSHALVYAPLLWRLASEEGIETITYSRTGCPLANLMNVQPQCQKFESTSIADILDKGAPQDIIFLPSLRLKRFVDQWGNLEKAEGKYQQEDEEDIKNRDLGYREAVALMDRLKQHRMRVIIEAPTPIYHAPAFRCSDWFNAHNPVCEGGLVISREEIRRYRAPVMEEISGLSDLYPDLIVWDPLPVLCPDETCRAITTSGQPLFFDGDHMSGLANRLLYPPFLSLLHRVWL